MIKLVLILPLLAAMLSSCNSNFVNIDKNVETGVVLIVNEPNLVKNIVPYVKLDPSLDSDSGIQKIPKFSPDGNFNKLIPGADIGSGFIINKNIIITNNHVVAGVNRNITIRGYNDMKYYKATIIARDAVADLAILKIDDWKDFDENVHPTILHWGESSDLLPGQQVWAIGNPYGFVSTLTSGIVSNSLRPDAEGQIYYVQTDASINPGNSGGPLFNKFGSVVGINTAIFGTKGYLGLSMTSDLAKKEISDMLNGGLIKNGYIGISMKPSDDQHHVMVYAIAKDTNAGKAGLLPGDIINSIYSPDSGTLVGIKEFYQLKYQIKLLDPGAEVVLYVTRKNHKGIIKINFILEGNKAKIDSLELNAKPKSTQMH